MKKYVYNFKEGNKTMKNLLGGKGANLSEMVNLGLPVPGGIIVSTEACVDYLKDYKFSESLKEEIITKLNELELETSKKFGDAVNPLLLSIRSGSRASMPGMMDTILNLGLNDLVVESLASNSSNPRFIYDSYRRLIQMYSEVVVGLEKTDFDKIFDDAKRNKNITLDTDLTTEDLKEIIKLFKKHFYAQTNEDFPQDPVYQLISSVEAVFKSWNNNRAITYRRINNIPSDWGTAVNIQQMVYGNLNDSSGTGVLFTRNPANGENKLFGEYLINAQGEDVVAGVRTPSDISVLKKDMPEVYNELLEICKRLENHYKDMQDMEFTIENNKLYILQTRSGKRTAQAAIKIALDMKEEEIITKEEALLLVDPKLLDQLLHPSFIEDEIKKEDIIGDGLAASPGAASGKIYFSASDAQKASLNNEHIILVREETSPEDIDGMLIAKGILTLRGGMTSHAAVVARGMGIPCVSGASNLQINQKTLITSDNQVFKEGDYISIDGTTGLIYKNKINTKEAELKDDFKEFIGYADEVRTLKVRANADNKSNAVEALNFGAEGIGLCRTEHMFFDEDRIFNFRKMILSNSKEEREKSLNILLEYQYKDFLEIFRVMKNLPVTIRYLDPPLHEFLPNEEKEILKLSDELNVDKDEIKKRINSLKEFNPMMGHRGVRLSITYPEITVMQTKAIIKAVLELAKENIVVKPEIMIPLISEEKEYLYIKDIIVNTINEISDNSFTDYKIGSMVETPRGCIITDKLSANTDFLSFGTNDLTQMTYGFSRDDATNFLDDYYKKQIFTFDPFATIDKEGVGELMKVAVHQARKIKPNISLGICGEHGGDPHSVELCYELGLDYVSCSPYRIPIAKLAAAQAALKHGSSGK